MSLIINPRYEPNNPPIFSAINVLADVVEQIQLAVFTIIAIQITAFEAVLSLAGRNITIIGPEEAPQNMPVTPMQTAPRQRAPEHFTDYVLQRNNDEADFIYDLPEDAPQMQTAPRQRDPEYFTDYVLQRNTDRLNTARTQNNDGADFIYDLIAGKEELKEQIESFDPEIFVTIPKMAVEAVITHQETPNRKNTPHFMHSDLPNLIRLHGNYHNRDTAKETVLKEARALASNMHQGNVDFNAAIEKALQKTANPQETVS